MAFDFKDWLVRLHRALIGGEMGFNGDDRRDGNVAGAA